MSYQESTKQLAGMRDQIAALRARMREVQAGIEPEPVENYVFATPEGPVSLSELFGAKDTLFVIHNMGTTCRYCTLWADGFNGVLPHLQSRAAFVLSSPDEPARQRQFAQSRGWKFPMVSHRGTSFARDMGYASDKGFNPGISVFRKRDGKILRVSDTGMGPYDDFCSVYHFFDLMPGGAGEWAPQFKY